MKDAISAQQQQIQQLQQQISTRDQAIQQLQQQIANMPAAPAATRTRSSQAVAMQLEALQHDVADLKTVSGNTVNELQETQKRVAGLESPLAIHYKGITITPGGFLAAETVWRQRAEGADINTNLNRIPYTGSSQAQAVGVLRIRPSVANFPAGAGQAGQHDLTGYFETDFLGAAYLQQQPEQLLRSASAPSVGRRPRCITAGASPAARCGAW